MRYTKKFHDLKIGRNFMVYCDWFRKTDQLKIYTIRDFPLEGKEKGYFVRDNNAHGLTGKLRSTPCFFDFDQDVVCFAYGHETEADAVREYDASRKI